VPIKSISQQSGKSVVQAHEAPTDPNQTFPTIEFVTPLPGFPDHDRFALVRIDEAGLLYSLRSLQDENLRFLTIAPHQFFDGYTPEIDDETVAAMGITQVEDLLMLLIVNTGDSPTEATCNLLAPIVVDRSTMRAAQVILTGTDLPVRAPLAGE
jgi:flagellar assembly factor FliW